MGDLGHATNWKPNNKAGLTRSKSVKLFVL